MLLRFTSQTVVAEPHRVWTRAASSSITNVLPWQHRSFRMKLSMSALCSWETKHDVSRASLVWKRTWLQMKCMLASVIISKCFTEHSDQRHLNVTQSHVIQCRQNQNFKVESKNVFIVFNLHLTFNKRTLTEKSVKVKTVTAGMFSVCVCVCVCVC